MDKLWAPWRIKYVAAKTKKGCIFCHGKKFPKKDLVIFTTPHSMVMINAFPYNNGHLMVSPKRHIKDFSYLSDTEILDLFKALNKTKSLLDTVLRPHGYNIGINISRASGAGIIGHMHIHIVPRWVGDTNFMPSLFETKVISQSLDELRKRLSDAYANTD